QGQRVDTFVAGVMSYLVLASGSVLTYGLGVFEDLAIISTVILAIAFPIGYLLYVVKERLLVLVTSLLFLFMGVCLLLVPLLTNPGTWLVFNLSALVLLQICWMTVILFSPLQQLTRRLGFVVVGVVTLIALSEISKLNLHQYLKPTKTS